MKHIPEFAKFLEDEVNLNKTRIDTLTKRVETIENFMRATEWNPIIRRVSPQGSWAHKTIIKPPGENGFDADLLVFVNPVEGWTANDYILELRSLFRSSGTYKELTGLKNRCVTLTYSGDFELDVVPCIVQRTTATLEVCNRADEKFEPTDSERYTEWFQRANTWAGGDHLIHSMRLVKYLRDTKQTFSCKSILLNTLIAERITQADVLYRNTNFPDLPSAFRTLITRLDDYLQSRPNLHRVTNPVLQMEDFNRHWDQDKYTNFRGMIHTYRGWTDEAYNEPDEKRSIKKWRWIFGDEFARSANVLAEEVSAALTINRGQYADAVQAVQSLGRSFLNAFRFDLPWVKPAPFTFVTNQNIPISLRATLHDGEKGPQIGTVVSGQIVPKFKNIKFEAVGSTGTVYNTKDYDVQWQVVNTDKDAVQAKALRGGFYASKPRGVKWEHLEYRGVHWVQAFLLRKRTGVCVGRSERFLVVIE
jgi:hypothetical protein